MDFVTADFVGNRWSEPISFVENIYFYMYFLSSLDSLWIVFIFGGVSLTTQNGMHAQSKAADINFEALN